MGLFAAKIARHSKLGKSIISQDKLGQEQLVPKLQNNGQKVRTSHTNFKNQIILRNFFDARNK